MKRLVDLKHVGPTDQVRELLDDLMDRLEVRLGHFPSGSVSTHVVFDEHKAHKLYRIALTCHVPGHVAVAHKEHRDAGAVIREAFSDVERQLDKQTAVIRHEPLQRRGSRDSFQAEPPDASDAVA